jgi:uncharacterized LabA/DUF88 family protein
MDAHVLIDYDNMLPHLRRLTLAPVARKLVATIDELVPGVTTILIRLYGGWYSEKGLTRNGTVLAQEIQRDFPILTAKAGVIVRRIHCEIASALIDFKTDVFMSTYRERSGMRSRLSAVLPSACIKPTTCSLPAVYAWSTGHCPERGCPVVPEDVFSYSEQKLVDTLLCCDLLALANRKPGPPVFVVSDDDDIVPAYILASANGALVHRIQMRQSTAHAYDSLLKQRNIRHALL